MGKDKLPEMLTGTRVCLREVEEKDLELLVQWRNDPENNKWFFNARPLTLDGQQKWLESVRNDPWREFFIITSMPENLKPVGTIGLCHIDHEHRCAEFGNLLIGEETDRGKGYTKEAVRLVLDHAFFDLGLNRLYLEVFSHNHVAISFYKRRGFVIEGVLRNARFKNGRYLNVIIMGLLKYEYLEAKHGK